ncbi:GGDEF domain-containing protein [uncultured Ruminococcus sp.]|uniref:GGDEF domain-containing protein n=1 Tax=uncultured Ruminococcus sp. TaxID=165186 RepID=UPI0025E8AA5E|nr:GGDEF domain-containing protein [uncultured Ruminococcus sp.]
MRTKRYNICLLAATLTDLFSNELVKGAITAAKRLGVHLTVIPGKYLGVQHINDQFEAYYEYQYNALFSYAAKARFDYVIAPVGTIAYSYSNELKKKFLDTFTDTHVLCVASDIEGYDCLEFNNGAGITSAVQYLAERGRKHIGIMAGSPEHCECIERCDAYRKGLEDNGLAFKESYIMYGDMSYDCKSEADRLLDLNPELDAVICINDIIASVVYTAIEEKGKVIGRDIAVVGFDDLPFAKELTPPLATVRADAFILGEVAVEKAYNYLCGIKDDRHLVDTRFIPRSSCLADTRFIDTPEMLFVGDSTAIKNKLMAHISDGSSSREEAEKIFKPLSELIDMTEQGFFHAPADASTASAIIAKMAEVFGKDGALGAETSRLYSLQENLIIWMIRNCLGENLKYVKQLSSTAEKTEKTMPQRFIARTHMENLFIRDSLMFGGDLKDSYADILKRLCNIGSVTSYLYILEEPVEHLDGTDYRGDVRWLFKSYCYGADCRTIPDEEQSMDTAGVFDNPRLVSDRTRILIAADLFSASTQYGLALLEPENFDIIDELELITYQLSSAVRSLDILKKLKGLLTDTKLALAMANDYKYIYCIDRRNSSYIQYERERTDKDFVLMGKGSDFFADCKKKARLIVHSDDLPLFRDMFIRESFLARIERDELFIFDYRYIKNGTAVYHRLKTIVGTDDNEGIVFIGISDIDHQKQLELKADEERQRFARISNALASRYELIYYINAVTGRYNAYTSGDKYNRLASVDQGDDFFTAAANNAELIIHPDDLAMVKDTLSRDKLLAMLHEDETVSLSYRQQIKDKLQYMNMNVVRMTDDDDYVIIAVNDATAAKLREFEIKKQLFKDALTGVKNKSAYKKAEEKLNTLIRENICEEFSVFVFDLNDLKKVNDIQGHDEGDRYIRAGSSLISGVFKHSPVYRIGGDEFAAVLTGTDYENREQLKESIRQQVMQNSQEGGVVIAVGSSDYINGKDSGVLDIFKRADKEMYADKRRLKSLT